MEKKGLTSFALKIIGFCAMILGSVPLVLGGEIFPYYRIFFRISAVLFAFVLTEGFYHTSSRTKYLVRLLIAGIVMYAGNHLVAYLTGNNLPLEYGMFLTLAAGFGAMWVFNWVREDGYSLESRMIGITAGAVLSILAMMFAESGFCVIPVVLIGFFFHGKKLWLSLLLIAISAVLAFNSIAYTPSGAIDWNLFFTENCDWSIIGLLPFILFYGGRSGPNRGFAKWFFYACYPLCVWACAVVGMYFTR